MIFLLDTNICIYIIKKKPAKVFERFRTLRLSDLGFHLSQWPNWNMEHTKVRIEAKMEGR